MKYFFSLLVASCISLFSFSQTTIKLEYVFKHVGDSVKVCGRVYGIRFLETAKVQPTFINMGGAFPNQLLTVVIWSDVRKTFETVSEELFKDKEICVVGKVELFRERAQVVVREKGQVVILTN
jgi:hypothetical protein